ncbi:MAG: ABC transporter ATP-binding protein [Clostridiales Family XIII bacterium]|jgi:ABC-type cobalamin/Fe3+-siderophores transport system ATPase subunit|nr:ABC transporter ATP-binding protein [Clostridiales Family XIII bacterium]
MMLRIDDLRTGYYKKEIVHGISFTVDSGDFACIIGANGCGKTTALKGILGLLPLYGGSVAVDGRIFAGAAGSGHSGNSGNSGDIGHSAGSGHSGHKNSHAVRVKDRAKVFAYIPQIHGLPFPFLVSDVVLLGRTPHLQSSVAGPSDADKEAAYNALEMLGIESIAKESYTELSGGQQQLVLIARALAQEPKILIMDEPTASLDFGNQQLVLDRMQNLSSRGMSVLMVTHDPHHALLCADKVIVMDEGEIIMEGTPEETITTKMLEKIYGTQVFVTTVQLESGDSVRTVIPVGRAQ